ncbi:MAG: hypothetical protein IPN89_15465 [Saprospiraceae bacterium]|nr:hypothetical protein [Saprospiraceae bacterium]
MKGLYSFFVILFMAQFLSAQDMPVIVISVEGNATYVPQNGKIIKLIPGATLLNSGKLNLKPGSAVQLYTNGQFVNVKTPGDVAFSSVFDSEKEVALDFEESFGRVVEDAVWNTMNSGVEIKAAKKMGDAWGAEKPGERGGWGADKPGDRGGWGADKPGDRGGWGADKPGERGGWGADKPGDRGGWGADKPGERGGWGAEKPGERGGWGKEDMKLMPDSPGGLYRNGVNTVKWEPISGVKEYEFYIFDENGNQVFSRKSKANQMRLEFKEAKLSPRKKYFWVAGKTQKPALVSRPVQFTVEDEQQINSTLAGVKNSDLYRKSNATIQSLMETVALENNQLFLEAKTKYEALAKANPTNNMVKMFYAEFCRKMGEYHLAKSIIKK